MIKLFSFLLCLVMAYAAPAPEPGFVSAPALAYRPNIAYGPALGYAALPAAAPLTYNAPYIASYPGAPFAYAKLGY